MSGRSGKRYKPKPYLIRFGEDHEFAGLEAEMRRPSIGDITAIAGFYELLGDFGTGYAMPTRAQMEALAEMIGALAPMVAWWNVDDDGGQPVIPDADGLKSQDPSLVMALFMAWFERTTSVSPPLPSGSPGGPTPMELASIPMAPMPASPPS